MTIMYRDFERNHKAEAGKEFSPTFYKHVFEKFIALFSKLYNIPYIVGDGVRIAEFSSILDTGVDYIGLAFDASLSTSNEYVGYVICAGNRVLEVYVDPPYRKQRIATNLIMEFKKFRKDEHQQFVSRWGGDHPELLKLATRTGFDVTMTASPWATGFAESIATTPVNMEYHNNIVDGADKSYIDFRGDHAVVDGHYTLKELESLLVLARKELTNAE